VIPGWTRIRAGPRRSRGCALAPARQMMSGAFIGLLAPQSAAYCSWSGDRRNEHRAERSRGLGGGFSVGGGLAGASVRLAEMPKGSVGGHDEARGRPAAVGFEFPASTQCSLQQGLQSRIRVPTYTEAFKAGAANGAGVRRRSAAGRPCVGPLRNVLLGRPWRARLFGHYQADRG
jgi:hypothetical protein